MDNQKPRWTDVKVQISKLEHADLVRLVGSLYQLGKVNRNFLHARFVSAEDRQRAHREVIDQCMYPDANRDWTFRIVEAKRAIGQYKKAVPDDRRGAADLMTYFVECGTRFCVDHQYLDDEPLCRTFLRMFDRAIRTVLELPEAERDEFRLRLREIVDSSTDMLWGYREELWDQYDDAFPPGGE